MFHKLIARATKSLHIDFTYITGSGSWIFSSYILGALIGLASVLVLANVVSPKVFGDYQFYLALLPFIGLVTLPGLNGIVVREVARGKKVSVLSMLFIQTKYGSWASALLFLVSIWLYVFGSFEQAIGFILLAVFTPFIFSSENAVSYLRGKKDFKRVAIHDLIIKFSTTTVVIIIAFVSPDPVLFLLLFLVVKYINRLILFYLVHRKNIKDEGETVDEEALVKEAQGMSLVGTLLTLSHSADRLLVWFILGSVGLASYSVALAFPQQISAVMLLLIHSILVPKLATRDTENNQYRESFLKKVYVFIAGYLVLGALYTAFAFLFIEQLFSNYEGIVWVSIFSLVSLGIPLITNILWLFFFVDKDYKTLWGAASLQWIGLGLFFVLIRPDTLIEIMVVLALKELLTVVFLSIRLVHKTSKRPQ